MYCILSTQNIFHCRKEGPAAPLYGHCQWTAIPQDHLDTWEMPPQDPLNILAPAQRTCPRTPHERTRSSTGSSLPKASDFRGQTPLTFLGHPGPRRLPYTLNPQRTANTLWGKQINPGMNKHTLKQHLFSKSEVHLILQSLLHQLKLIKWTL